MRKQVNGAKVGIATIIMVVGIILGVFGTYYEEFPNNWMLRNGIIIGTLCCFFGSVVMVRFKDIATIHKVILIWPCFMISAGCILSSAGTNFEAFPRIMLIRHGIWIGPCMILCGFVWRKAYMQILEEREERDTYL